MIWHLRGATKLPSDVSDTIIFERLENFLAKQRKPITEQTASSIEFSSPLWEGFSTPNWLALVIYDQGKFWIESGLEGRSLRYDLRSLHGLIFCSFAALMFLIFVGSLEGIAAGSKIALIAFAWLYGGNMILTLGRVPGAIRNALNGS